MASSYLNDVLCVGVVVPIMLFAARWVKFRRHDMPPTAEEIIVAVLVWSLMYEVALPRFDFWATPMTPDPFDVTAYAVGGALVSLAWRWAYAKGV
ncbi:MAG: hypothetical protein AAGH99_05695 [Planctomycetota bacterium]